MDPWVNSLVQSPLVRSLNTIPSRMSSFAHGVRDNVPPFSMTKEVIDPYTPAGVGWVPDQFGTAPAASNVEQTFSFRIPQSGLLNRAYLRVRAYQPYSAGSARGPLWRLDNPTAAEHVLRESGGVFSSSLNFANCFDNATLSTSNKTIQTLYAPAIAAEVRKMPDAMREFFMASLNGYAAGFTHSTPSSASQLALFRHLYDPAFYEVESGTPLAERANGAQQHLYVDFIIPLPFAVLDQLKDNFQTRFVENLEVKVKMKGAVGITSGTGTSGVNGYRMSLVCLYHNFHDVIENSIRDQNYKRGFPASIYTHDYVREGRIEAPSTGNKLQCFIQSVNLVSEIILQIKRKVPSVTQVSTTATSVGLEYGPMRRDSHSERLNLKITMTGSGRTIWEAYARELGGPDLHDYPLADGHAYGDDLVEQPLKAPVRTTTRAITDAAQTAFLAMTTSTIRVGGCVLGFEGMHCMRFGFQAKDNYYTGGLALQTISNPTITIEALGGSMDNPWNTFTFDVILKTCNMLRIDSDTGIITRTLDV